VNTAGNLNLDSYQGKIITGKTENEAKYHNVLFFPNSQPYPGALLLSAG